MSDPTFPTELLTVLKCSKFMAPSDSEIFQKHIHINYINDCGFGEPPVFVTITIYQFEIFAFLSASLAKQNWTWSKISNLLKFRNWKYKILCDPRYKLIVYTLSSIWVYLCLSKYMIHDIPVIEACNFNKSDFVCIGSPIELHSWRKWYGLQVPVFLWAHSEVWRLEGKTQQWETFTWTWSVKRLDDSHPFIPKCAYMEALYCPDTLHNVNDIDNVWH